MFNKENKNKQVGNVNNNSKRKNNKSFGKKENKNHDDKENKNLEMRDMLINKLNKLNNDEIIDLLVFIENIRPQAIKELPNDTLYINIKEFTNDTFIKDLDYLK